MNVRNTGPSSTIDFGLLRKLFTEYGRAIQILVTQCEYTDLSDMNQVESDAAQLTENLFERFVYVPEIIEMVSGHLNTGKPLPSETLERIKQHDLNFKAFNLMKQTFLSAFDIECHIR